MRSGIITTTDKAGRKKKLRRLSALLLVLNGIPALITGSAMIWDPTGQLIGLNVRQLESSPFKNFLLPGIVLFVVNGVFSLLVLYALIRSAGRYPLLILLQGIFLTGWICFQIFFITDPSWLQLAYGFLGAALILMGIKLENLLYERVTA